MFDHLFEIHDGASKLDPLFHWSLKKALAAQGMSKLYSQLIAVLPDISNQYTNPDGMNCMDPQSPDYVAFYADKVRAQHSFQVYYTIKMLEKYATDKPLVLVDVGDSSGNHIKYLQALQKDYKYRIEEAYSVNLDEKAIEKVNNNGGKGILCRAEKLHEIGINADVLLSFEMLEHLSSPVDFLHQLSKQPPSKFALFTVPFIRKSRMGLHHIRLNINDYAADPEDVHIFELCPDDWKLLAKHAGWRVIDEMIYYQYPPNMLYRALRPLWQKYEYEGFYGFTLVPDAQWRDLYTGW